MCVCILNYRDFASSGDHDITSVAMEMPRGFDFTLPVIIIDMLWGWILSWPHRVASMPLYFGLSVVDMSSHYWLLYGRAVTEVSLGVEALRFDPPHAQIVLPWARYVPETPLQVVDPINAQQIISVSRPRSKLDKHCQHACQLLYITGTMQTKPDQQHIKDPVPWRKLIKQPSLNCSRWASFLRGNEQETTSHAATIFLLKTCALMARTVVKKIRKENVVYDSKTHWVESTDCLWKEKMNN